MFYSFDPYVTADTDLSEEQVFADFDPAFGSGSMLAEPTLDNAEGEELLLGVSIYA